ncbi:hypothetical protein CBM2599_B51391 [Cupriavidus taiwanensis]|nr:hypothetical protein CBM2599_B51391 [Cupriavidus taiwanensis]SOZ00388.1 hypothetical protein CBM2600_B70402 [Cupriavidus taiwanensis]
MKLILVTWQPLAASRSRRRAKNGPFGPCSNRMRRCLAIWSRDAGSIATGTARSCGAAAPVPGDKPGRPMLPDGSLKDNIAATLLLLSYSVI